MRRPSLVVILCVAALANTLLAQLGILSCLAYAGAAIAMIGLAAELCPSSN